MEDINYEAVHTLKLGYMIISTSDVEAISLRNVDVGPDGAERIVQGFQENETCTALDLGNCGLTDEGVATILQMLASNKCRIRHLKLDENEVKGTRLELLETVIAKSTTLESLDLSNNHLSSKGANHLSAGIEKSGSLKALLVNHNPSLGDRGGEAILKGLGSNPTIQRIEMNNCGLGAKGFTQLNRLIALNIPHLVSISVSENELDPLLAYALANSIKTNLYLKQLNLSSNKINHHGGFAFADLLRENHQLAELDLSHNPIGKDVATNMRNALQENKGLEILKLADVQLTCAGSCEVVEAVANLETLRHLDLSSNEIKFPCADKLRYLLSVKGSRLSYLNLSKNELRDNGVSRVSSALAKNNTLEHLNLALNGIGEQGGMKLASALHSNTALKVLDLSDNPIGGKALASFTNLLDNNKTITKIEISSKLAEVITKKLEQNMKEKQLAAKKAILNAITKLDTIPWNRAKLMVVGEEGVGKSSLVRSLLGKTFEPKSKGTAGVDTVPSVLIKTVQETGNATSNKNKPLSARSGKNSIWIVSDKKTSMLDEIVLLAGASQMKVEGVAKEAKPEKQVGQSGSAAMGAAPVPKTKQFRPENSAQRKSSRRLPSLPQVGRKRGSERTGQSAELFESFDSIVYLDQEQKGEQPVKKRSSMLQSAGFRSQFGGSKRLGSVTKFAGKEVKKLFHKVKTGIGQKHKILAPTKLGKPMTDDTTSGSEDSVVMTNKGYDNASDGGSLNSVEYRPDPLQDPVHGDEQQRNTQQDDVSGSEEDPKLQEAGFQNIMTSLTFNKFPEGHELAQTKEVKGGEYHQTKFLRNNREDKRKIRMSNLRYVMGSEELDRRISTNLLINKVYDKNGSENQQEEWSLNLMIWDYSGNRFFYTLHHMFLTNEGVFLVVFSLPDVYQSLTHAQAGEAEKDSFAQLLRWLQMIKLHAKDSPVLLIGTHLSSLSDKIALKKVSDAIKKADIIRLNDVKIVFNKEDGLTYFPIENNVNVTAPNGADPAISTDMTKLHSRIEDAVRNLRAVKQKVPVRWIRCLDRIFKEEDAFFLRLTEVKALAKNCGIGDESEVREMLNLFHRLGAVYYLSTTDKLSSFITVNPQWLIENITQIMPQNHSNVDLFKKEEEVQLLEALKSVDLEEDYHHFRENSIITKELLSYFWGTEALDFMTDLLERALIICKWSFRNNQIGLSAEDGRRVSILSESSDQAALKKVLSKRQPRSATGSVQYLIPAGLPDQLDAGDTSDLGQEHTTCIIDFSDSFLPNGVFERLLCLSVAYGSILSSERHEQVPAPRLSRKDSVLWFGSTLCCRLTLDDVGNRILLSADKANSDPGRCLLLLLTFLNKVNYEIMSASLIWDIQFQSSGESMITATEAKELETFKPWFFSQFDKKLVEVDQGEYSSSSSDYYLFFEFL